MITSYIRFTQPELIIAFPFPSSSSLDELLISCLPGGNEGPATFVQLPVQCQSQSEYISDVE